MAQSSISTPMTLSERIKETARRLGFDQVGISRVGEGVEREAAERLRTWLSRGYHGEMHWMDRNADKRTDIDQVLNDIRSVVSVAMNYYTGHQPDESAGNGRIARYAWGDDYHDIFGKRLSRLEDRIHEEAPNRGLPCRTLSYVDTGPVMEKVWAQRAGIGWIGKHTNLVSTEYGSWLLLGEVLTTLALDPDEPAADQCGACRLCIEICPTKAITEPYVLDARKCISYLTIEHRGPISERYHSAIGNRIFGCDDCLDICPYNDAAHPTTEDAFAPRDYSLSPPLKSLGDQSPEEFRTMFRKSPVKRPTYEGFKRNIQIASKNAPLTLPSPPSGGRG